MIGEARGAAGLSSPARVSARTASHASWAAAVALDLAILFALKSALGAWVLRDGFSHVSDDDYARVVIAQTFAHAPALDPSGTSWLPFPFWLTGSAMLVFGRTLAVARGVAFVLGVLSVGLPYAAMRIVGCGRATALAGIGVAMALPWSVWLGVATVPEAMTACLIATGAVVAGSGSARVFGAVCLLAAGLSRYEAWPVCGVVAVASVWRIASPRGAATASAHPRPLSRKWPLSHQRGELWRTVGEIAIAVAGPLGWLAWNAHAHGSAFHFVARVAAYRQAMGAASEPLVTKLTSFPVALFTASPMIVGLAVLGGVAFVRDTSVRARWTWPLVSAAAILAFLVYGDVNDGAPTHHPERAVVPVLWILALFAADALRALARRVAWARPAREMWVVGAGMAGVVAFCWTLPARLADHPATAPDESREAQIARGLTLGSDPSVTGFTVTPCAYEHFALIAAYAAPERVTIAPATHAPVTAACPAVER